MKKDGGFGVSVVLLVALVIALVCGGGYYVYSRNHKKSAAAINKPNSNNASQTPSKDNTQAANTELADPYVGWKNFCDTTLKACFKYPSDWTPVVGSTNAFENSSQTGYASLTGPTIKDGGSENAYIAKVEDTTPPIDGLKVVGFFSEDSKPIYQIHDSSLSFDQLIVGSTIKFPSINYRFNDKYGNHIGLSVTPNINGYAAITNAEQAKAWFNSDEGKTGLKIAQSFYYL